jgi:hypothetical protein
MNILSKIGNFFKSTEGKILFFLSAALFADSLLLTFQKAGFLAAFKYVSSSDWLYLAYFVFFTGIIGVILFYAEEFSWGKIIEKFIWAYFPAEIVFLFGIANDFVYHYFFHFLTGFYVIFIGTYLIYKRKSAWKTSFPEKKTLPERMRSWIARQGWMVIAIILLVMAANFAFGFYHIEKFAAVDEPLWLFDRIPEYWHSLKDQVWKDTMVSDKPGITVSILSGAGLIWENPQNYQILNWQSKFYRPFQTIESMYLALRLPLLIFAVLILPLFYYFLEKLLGKKIAIFSYFLLGTSPILIGIVRIINPDSLLWIFTTLSVLAYLVYLKNRRKSFLFLAGAFLGFSILTKYVSTILFIFFLGMIFLEYVFNKNNYSAFSVKSYLKESLLDYFTVAFFALSTFFILCPASWFDYKLLTFATIDSQAFSPVKLYFVILVASIIADIFIFKGKIYSLILNFLAARKKVIAAIIFSIFLGSIVFVLINVYVGMRFFDFEEMLISPKSSHKLEIGSIGIFFANFYPLVFGIIPVSLLALFFASFKALREFVKNNARPESIAVFYLVIFILLYYAGSAVNNVASINRYQIMVFPIALILGGIGLGKVFDYLRLNGSRKLVAFYLAVFILGIYSLFATVPFYASYASALLPKKYTLDLKDMGVGSYEAAEFLNSLPDAQNLSIWTDKKGVCYIFKGNCYTGLTISELSQANLDYLVLSSGRESRTTKMSRSLKIKKDSPFNFNLYYADDYPTVFRLNVNGREGQYVKVVKFEK